MDNQIKKEKAETKKLKKSKMDKRGFAHLGNASKVASKKNNNWLRGAIVGGIVTIVIFVIVISNNQHKKVTYRQQGSMINNDAIFRQNEKKLAELQNQKNVQPVMQQDFFKTTSHKEDKQMKSRRNAPTQMYVSESSNMQSESDVNDKIMAGNDALSKFSNSQSEAAPIVRGDKIKYPNYTVAEGELIPAVLETAINSDLPGMVRAVITRPIYAYTGEDALIPAGSRLIGQYASIATNGAATRRILVIWNRVITPQGISIMINSPGTDSLGRAGVEADTVNTHFFKIFGTAVLLSVIGATASTSGVGSYDQPNSANMYRQSIAQAFQSSAQAALSQNLNIKATLNINQGAEINVFVARDLDLYNVLESSE